MPLKIEGQGSGDRLLLSLEDPCVLPNRLIAIRQDGPRYKLFPTSFDSVHASDACLLFIKGFYAAVDRICRLWSDASLSQRTPQPDTVSGRHEPLVDQQHFAYSYL